MNEKDPLLHFITVPDSPIFDIAGEDPPEYEPDEEPAEDFPLEEEPWHDVDKEYSERERLEAAYAPLLEETLQTLREVNRKLHQHMMTRPGEDQFAELYIITRHIHAVNDTIRIFAKHEYKPFLGRKRDEHPAAPH